MNKQTEVQEKDLGWCIFCEKLTEDDQLNCDLCFKPGCVKCIQADQAGRLLCPRCKSILVKGGFYESSD